MIKGFSSLFDNDLHSFEKNQENYKLQSFQPYFTPKITMEKTNTKSSHSGRSTSSNVYIFNISVERVDDGS